MKGEIVDSVHMLLGNEDSMKETLHCCTGHASHYYGVIQEYCLFEISKRKKIGLYSFIEPSVFKYER